MKGFMNFKKWLKLLEAEELTGDEQLFDQLRKDIEDLLNDLRIWEKIFTGGPTKKWLHDSSVALHGATTESGQVTIKKLQKVSINQFSALRRYVDNSDNLKYPIYGKDWKNIMPQPAENDEVGKDTYANVSHAVEILNKSTIQNSISEDQLEEIKNFIKAGYLEREHTTSEGKVIKIKNLPISENRPFYQLADIVRRYKNIVNRIYDAQQTPEQRRAEKAERDKAAAAAQAAVNQELERIADAPVADKLKNQLLEILEVVESSFIEETYNKFKHDYDQMQAAKTELIRANSGSKWYRIIDKKTEQESKAIIKDVFSSIKDAYLNRMIAKLGPIVQAKKSQHGADFNIERKPNDIKVYGPSIESNLNFKFTDGSSLVVRQKSVLKESILGKLFYQFPTTFHNVIFSNGEKMLNPNEISVYKNFATLRIVPPDVPIQVQM